MKGVDGGNSFRMEVFGFSTKISVKVGKFSLVVSSNALVDMRQLS